MSGYFRPGIETGLEPKTPAQKQYEADAKRREAISDQRYGYSLTLDALRQASENQSREIYNNINMAEALAANAGLQSNIAGIGYGLSGDSFQNQLASGRLRGDINATRVGQARAVRNALQELRRLELDQAQRASQMVPNDFMEVTRGLGFQ